MEGDSRLNSQLKTLGKKLFQFRDLVSKMDIPESLPEPPHDRIFWDVFVKKCTSAVTVLKQVQASLTPDLYHLAVHPGTKIWRNPAAVPDLLSMPDLVSCESENPVARSLDEVSAWNSALEEAIAVIEQYTDAPTVAVTRLPAAKTNLSSTFPDSTLDKEKITSLFNSRGTERVLASTVG